VDYIRPAALAGVAFSDALVRAAPLLSRGGRPQELLGGRLLGRLYLKALRHPAASASSSEKNHRSPALSSTRVLSQR